jgi:hypothetical protein
MAKFEGNHLRSALTKSEGVPRFLAELATELNGLPGIGFSDGTSRVARLHRVTDE